MRHIKLASSRFRYLLPAVTFLLFFLTVPTAFGAGDCWITPHGAGLKNGTSPGNAYPASKAQTCWNQTGTENTMFVAEGLYSAKSETFWQLEIDADSGGRLKNKKPKRLIGMGEVLIEGRRPIPYESKNKDNGETWIQIKEGANHLLIENFSVERVQTGVEALRGGNHQVTLNHLDFTDTRQNVIFYGHPECKSSGSCHVPVDAVTSGIKILNTTGVRYSKRHIRLSHGIHDVLVEQSYADAQYQDGDFAVGFDVEGPSHDIEFRNAVARRNVYSVSEYWNGDGFKAEKETFHITWTQCAAFENADAGFDIKTPAPEMNFIVAQSNSRNIRIWSKQQALLKHIVSSSAVSLGGVGTPSGLWAEGQVECRLCIVQDNPVQVHTETGNGHRVLVTFIDSVVTAKASQKLTLKEENTDVWFKNSVVRQDQN